MPLFADVVLPLPLERSFVYSVPSSSREKPAVGVRVLVSFNRRQLTGIIVGLSNDPPSGDFRVKPVMEVLDPHPLMTADLLEFTRELAVLSHVSWGEMLQAALPPSLLPRSRTRFQATPEGKAFLKDGKGEGEERLLLSRLADSAYTEAYLRRSLKMTRIGPLLQKLQRLGYVRRDFDIDRPKRRQPKAAAAGTHQLNMDFALDRASLQFARRLSERLTGGRFTPSLFRGPRVVREAVYFELIRACLRAKKRVLYLVPEIVLTESAAERFEAVIGRGAALLHSRLSDRQREIEWRRIRSGDADVVLGSRSALLAPIEGLGLVLLDEEQDDSFVQRDNPVSDVRRGAWVRARRCGALLVYGSERPSVEVWYRAGAGGWLEDRSNPPVERRITILDDSVEKGLTDGATGLAIRERLRKGEQVLVFCNRRGYAPYLSCALCRHVPRCDRCDVALSYHKQRSRLVCHACNSTFPLPGKCPVCGGRLAGRKGAGVEVIEEALKHKFPDLRIAGFHADEAGTRKKRRVLLESFQDKRIDILVGTGMLARRMELPRVGLVVIYYPEVGLDLPDFRMGQKTFENISRMIGHLLPDKTAEAIIRTALPQHYSIRTAAAGDYKAFVDQELEYRRMMRYPPFALMAEVVLEGENMRALALRSRKFVSALKRWDAGLEILGPALAPVSRLRGRHRVQVLIKSDADRDLDGALTAALAGTPGRRQVFLSK